MLGIDFEANSQCAYINTANSLKSIEKLDYLTLLQYFNRQLRKNTDCKKSLAEKTKSVRVFNLPELLVFNGCTRQSITN